MAPRDTTTDLYKETARLQQTFSRIAGRLCDTFFRSGQAPGSSDALQEVVDFTRVLLYAEKCALYTVDAPKRSLILERVSGAVQFDKLKDVGTYSIAGYGPSQSGTGVTPWVWHTKRSFNARSFDELVHNSEGHWKGNWDAAMYGDREIARQDFKCVYMVPLLAGKECIGVLKYENREGEKQAFDKDDERLIDMIGALITHLVISQRIERNRYDMILPRISTTLISSFGQPSFYEQLLEQCREILAADLCSLFLLDNRDNLVLREIVGTLNETTKSKLAGFHYENYKEPTESRGLTSWILREGRAFNARNFPDLQARSEGHHLGAWDAIVYHGRPEVEFKSLYSTPLIVGEHKIGVLKLENKNVPPYYFTESDETLFDLIGRLIAIGAIYDTEKYLGTITRSAELGFMAAGIAHEFNNYLQGFANVVAITRDVSDQDQVKEHLQVLTTRIDSAANMINEFKRIKNRQESSEPFDPDVLVNDILALCKHRFENHNIQIEYHNTGVGRLELNPSDFQTILVNLVNNAFESVADKGEVGAVNVIIRPDAPGRFCLVVEDTGQGIPGGQEEHIFAPFFTTKAPAGMGFGLFGVQRVVRAAGGEIKAIPQNRFGGATFEIILPVSSGIQSGGM